MVCQTIWSTIGIYCDNFAPFYLAYVPFMLGYNISQFGNEVGHIHKGHFLDHLSSIATRKSEGPILRHHVVTHNLLGKLSHLPLTCDMDIHRLEPSIQVILTRCALSRVKYIYLLITLSLFQGMERLAFNAKEWSVGIVIGSPAS